VRSIVGTVAKGGEGEGNDEIDLRRAMRLVRARRDQRKCLISKGTPYKDVGLRTVTEPTMLGLRC